MLGVLKCLKTLYLNLRIKHKMFVMISFVMLLVCLCTLGLMQYVFRVYNNELYVQSSRSLNLTAYSVENELKKMERLSFRLATDLFIQRNLRKINNEGTSYGLYISSENIKDRMAELIASEKYVLSVQIKPSLGQEIRFGNQTVEIDSDKYEQIEKAAEEGQGGHRWVLPEEQETVLIATRLMRSYENMDLDKLGTLALRIPFEKLLNDYSRGLESQGAQLFLVSYEGPILADELPIPEAMVREAMERESGYKIVGHQGKRYFLTYIPSDYAEWTYVILIPYSNLFQTIVNVQNIVIVVFTVLFAAAILFAVQFAAGMTRPIESLNRKMKQVQKGNFDLAEEEEYAFFPMDEAGQLHRNFRMMLQRIKDLIEENYTKQIAIKESEYKALQAQINPHFLYNTLDSINWHARMAHKPEISRMVESLGHLLRNAINNKKPIIALHEELSIIRHYITIQKLRYEERLECHLWIPPNLEGCLVPRMVIQPLIENSIQYGLERMLGTCVIHVSARANGDVLELTVTDNGPGFDPEQIDGIIRGEVPAKGSGVGLRNIHDRIRLIFGEAYGIEIRSWAEGAEVMLKIPLCWEEEAYVSSAVSR